MVLRYRGLSPSGRLFERMSLTSSPLPEILAGKDSTSLLVGLSSCHISIITRVLGSPIPAQGGSGAMRRRQMAGNSPAFIQQVAVSTCMFIVPVSVEI